MLALLLLLTPFIPHNVGTLFLVLNTCCQSQQGTRSATAASAPTWSSTSATSAPSAASPSNHRWAWSRCCMLCIGTVYCLQPARCTLRPAHHHICLVCPSKNIRRSTNATNGVYQAVNFHAVGIFYLCSKLQAACINCCENNRFTSSQLHLHAVHMQAPNFSLQQLIHNFISERHRVGEPPAGTSGSGAVSRSQGEEAQQQSLSPAEEHARLMALLQLDNPGQMQMLQ
jgi:hypothetical protein